MNSEKNIDNVNNPSHYSTGKYECIEVMREALGDEAVKNFCLCNAFKYIYRTNRKNGLEDVRKARWYIDYYITLSELIDVKEEQDKIIKTCTDDEECDDIEVDLKDMALYSQMMQDMFEKYYKK